MKYRVSITRCGSYAGGDALDSVRRAVELLGGMKSFVNKGERILLKPNLLAAKEADAAVTTHPAMVKAVALLVREAGGVPFVGDSPGLGSAGKVAARCGIAAVADELGMEIVDLKTPVTVEHPKGFTFKRFELAKEALDADGIINIPKLKTHAQMALTAGVKNIFGCVPGKRKVQWHFAAGVDTSRFASMLVDLHLLVRPRLTVLDAVVSMEGNGPGSGDPRRTGFVAASESAFSLDTAVCKMLGKDPMEVPVLKRAIELKLPDVNADDIETAGGDLQGIEAKDFVFPPPVSTDFGAALPRFMSNYLRKALTSRPVINAAACTLCNICVKTCPAGVMSEKGRIIIDYDGCIRCYCCQEMCPEGAISAGAGWLKKLVSGL